MSENTKLKENSVKHAYSTSSTIQKALQNFQFTERRAPQKPFYNNSKQPAKKPETRLLENIVKSQPESSQDGADRALLSKQQQQQQQQQDKNPPSA